MIQDDLDIDWGVKMKEKSILQHGQMNMYVNGKFVRQFSYSDRWNDIIEFDNHPFCLRLESILIKLPDKQTAENYLDWINSVIDEGSTEEAKEYIRQKKEKELAEEREFELCRQEREARRQQWEIVKTYRFQKPSGGEEGIDGFSDREYRSASTGNIIRMIQRDIFDFGTQCCPKRLAEKGGALDWKYWTQEEKELAKWLGEFGFGSGVRI